MVLSPERVGRITGSVAGACLGLSKFKSKAAVIREMVRAYHGAPEEFEDMFITLYGKFCEPHAMICYEMETNDTIQPCGFYAYNDWLGATPDGLILGGTGILEVKSPWNLRNIISPDFKLILPEYYAQVQIELLSTNLKFAHFYQWSPFGSEITFINRDSNWLTNNLPRLKAVHNEYLAELDNPAHLQPLVKRTRKKKNET